MQDDNGTREMMFKGSAIALYMESVSVNRPVAFFGVFFIAREFYKALRYYFQLQDRRNGSCLIGFYTINLSNKSHIVAKRYCN